MGTLSRRRQREVISVGERCLLGANSGLGISLGDDCVVEAGLYVTAGTRVTLPGRRGRQGGASSAARAACCSAATRRPGAIEALPRSGRVGRPQRGAAHRPVARRAARRRARTPRASGRARGAGSRGPRRRRTTRARARSRPRAARAASTSACGPASSQRKNVASPPALRRPWRSSTGSSTSRLAR